jgi:hypothetical protein
MKRIALLIVMSIAVPGAYAAAPAPSAYAGQESRDVKSLSAADVADLQAGKGMGLAKAAELNGYPGPAHVLELASELKLSEPQRAATQRLFAAMQARAIELGRELLTAERKLDSSFANRSITNESLASTLRQIGELQAELRGAHLEAHLAQIQILTPDQVATYTRLRGYGASKGSDGHTHGRH